MKKTVRFLSLILFFIVGSFVLVSCSPYKELVKASKGLTSYEIKAVLNEENMSVDATMVVEVVNKTDVALNSICFNLYGRAFREGALIKPYTSLNQGKCFVNGLSYGDLVVENVEVEDKTTSFSIVGEDENALEIKLDKDFEPKDKVCVKIDFSLILAECAHRLGYLNGSINLGNWFPILAIYEKGEYNIEPYYSTGDPFYSDIANYSVEFTYPNKYTMSSSGTEKSSCLEGTSKTSCLEALAVRDFAVFLTEEANKKSKVVDNITINYVGYDGDNNVDYLLSVAEKTVCYFNKTFGKYPYKKLDIVKAPFLHGGMEYPSAVIISDSVTQDYDIAKVIVHEIAHQWWYAVVGNNEIKEAWLDESLAEYSTVLFFAKHKEFDVSYEELISESFANYVLYADIIKSVNKDINTSMLLKVNEYNSEYEYSYMIYVRGVLMFDSLRDVIGESKLIKGLKKFYTKYKFSIATTDDFIVSMRKAAGKDIETFMDSWLQGKTVIGTI